MSKSIIPANTVLGQQMRAATRCRVVLIVGLPSTGKSFMFQQLTILAHEAGRIVHTVQWDDARRVFETPEWLQAYPEDNNLTHPGIRKAVGFWVREGVLKWHKSHEEAEHILVVELPVVAGRFVELLQKQDDEAEQLLGSDQTCVLVPVPTNAVRRQVEGFREASFANPRNPLEAKDAPPHIVQNDWLTARRLYNRWNDIADDEERDMNYDDIVVKAVFERLCRYRNTRVLNVEEVFSTTGSAYDNPVPLQKFHASPEEVEAAYERLQSAFPGKQAERATDGWSDY